MYTGAQRGDNSTGKYKVYTVNGPINGGTNITLTADTKVTVSVTAVDDGKEFYYYEDFSTNTDTDSANVWNNGGGNYRGSKFAADSGNVYLNGIAADSKGVGNLVHKLDTPVTLTDNTVTVEFDMMPGGSMVSVTGGEVSLGDNVSDSSTYSDNPAPVGNVFSIGRYGDDAGALKYYTGGLFAIAVSGGTGTFTWGANITSGSATAISATAVKDSTFTEKKWYSVKLVIKDSNGTLTVTERGGDTTAQVAQIPINNANIAYIKTSFGKVLGGSNDSSGKKSECAIDNIKIY